MMKKILVKIRQKIAKVLPIWVICGLVVGTCWWILREHYFRYAILKRDPLYRIESTWYDIKLTILRGPQKPTGQVGILAIDEESLHEFGSWPFSRRHYAQAYANLKNLGVKWIGFDAIYDKPERASAIDIEEQLLKIKNAPSNARSEYVNQALQTLEQMKQASPADKIFAKGLENFGNIVMGYFYIESKYEAD